MNPAHRIIAKFGHGDFGAGVSLVAELLGVHPSRVHRWTYPKARGGSDGRIPSSHQQALLDAAGERGVPLSPADFFEASDNGHAAAEPRESAA